MTQCQLFSPLNHLSQRMSSINIAEQEQDKKQNMLKMKCHDYTGYNDKEFTGTPGMRHTVLSKYVNGGGQGTPYLCLRGWFGAFSLGATMSFGLL